MRRNLIFDPFRHKLDFFKGSCDKTRPFCRAMCCRNWDIYLAREEYEEGLYRAEAVCAKDKSPCRMPQKHCLQRLFRIKKKKDGSCFYLKDDLCTVYNARPVVCRNFSCEKGWKLAPVVTACAAVDEAEVVSFGQGLRPSLKMILNPYLTLKAVSRRKSKLILLFKDRRYCRTHQVTLEAVSDFVDAAVARKMLKSFDGKKSLGGIFARLPSRGVRKLPKEDFYNLMLYLYDEDVLVPLSRA